MSHRPVDIVVADDNEMLLACFPKHWKSADIRSEVPSAD